MTEIGYWGLFIASFLSATILPFSSEAIIAGMIVGGYDSSLCVMIASAGNWIGSMSTYTLGYIGNWNKIEKWLKIDHKKSERYVSLSRQYGYWLGLLVWLPAIGDVIALALGLVRTPIILTSITILIGKFLRYSIIAWLTLSGIDVLT